PVPRSPRAGAHWRRPRCPPRRSAEARDRPRRRLAHAGGAARMSRRLVAGSAGAFAGVGLFGAVTGYLASQAGAIGPVWAWLAGIDRKSTRLNSSHVKISYAVFCLKKQ